MKRFLKIFLLIAILYSFLQNACKAQPSPVYGAGDIRQLLLQLQNAGNVLYLAAHPDDENNRLLSYLVKYRGIRTAYLAMNRGEGGQNLIGKEQGDALGLIRTQELLAARKTDGAGQFFTRAYDFGYSKSPEETLSIWNKDSVLSDIVWVIRTFRPSVIICRFPTTGEGGHGHHTASALLAVEAVKAAADPSRFTSQLAFTRTWQVTRVLWNTFNFGGVNTTSPDQFSVDVNPYNPLLGKSMGEIAGESRSFHKSQGFGALKSRGPTEEFFKLVYGSPIKKDIFDSVPMRCAQREDFKSAAASFSEALDQFNDAHPENTIPTLVKGYRALDRVRDPALKAEKQQEIKQLLAACSGLWIEAACKDKNVSFGDTVPLSVSIMVRTSVHFKMDSILFHGKKLAASISLSPKVVEQFNTTIQPDSSDDTQPYWLKLPHTQAGYVFHSLTLKGKSQNDPTPALDGYFTFEGLSVHIPVPVIYKRADPVAGEIIDPVSVLPPLSIEPQSNLLVFSATRTKKLAVRVVANARNQRGVLSLSLPSGYKASPVSFPFFLNGKDETVTDTFQISPPAVQENGLDLLYVTAKTHGNTWNSAVRKMNYPHITSITYTQTASVRLLHPLLKNGVRHVAYIEGAGDEIPQVLGQLGISTTALSDQDLNASDLSQYRVIILGIRAYNTRKVLNAAYRKLMAYVQNGGTLLVQYNNPNRLVTEQIGPYPLVITGDRVAEENSTVAITLPNSPLLNYPNKIDADDFRGWVQERGLYFLQPSHAYTAIVSMHDSTESPLATGIVSTQYGRGMFIYTSLSFFRQLPAGVPGAIRLFVNLINATAQPTKK